MYRHAPFFEAGTWELPTTRRLFGNVEVSPFDDASFIEQQLTRGTEIDQWDTSTVDAVATTAAMPARWNPLDPLGLGKKFAGSVQGYVVLILLALLGASLVAIGTYATIKKG